VLKVQKIAQNRPKSALNRAVTQYELLNLESARGIVNCEWCGLFSELAFQTSKTVLTLQAWCGSEIRGDGNVATPLAPAPAPYVLKGHAIPGTGRCRQMSTKGGPTGSMFYTRNCSDWKTMSLVSQVESQRGQETKILQAWFVKCEWDGEL